MSPESLWDEEAVEQYPYTYYVWLGKCPFCLRDVNESIVLDYQEGLGVCPNCESKIQVRWMGIGKTQQKYLLDEINPSLPPYKEILFGEVCEKLRLKEYFLFLLDAAADDEIDTYVNLLIEWPEIVRRFRTSSGKMGFLCHKDEKTRNVFGFKPNIAQKSERNEFYNPKLEKAVMRAFEEEFDKLIMLAVVESEGQRISLVKDEDRERYARFFRKHHDEILEAHSFDIVLEKEDY